MKESVKSGLFSGIYLFGICILLFFVEKTEFISILLGFTISFSAYIFLLRSQSFKLLLALAIIVRIVSLLSFPHLSDDIYRFIWDGLQWTQGQNPFEWLPIDKLNPSGFEEELIRKMNSPEYFSIYPPVLQLLFTVTVFIIPSPLLWQVICMKLIILALEFIGIYFIYKLLNKLKLPKANLFIYALNPLIVVELLGNLHLEILMISFLAVSFYYLYKRKWIQSAFFLSLSVASKLVTVLLIPLLVKQLGFQKWVRYTLVFGISIMFMFGIMLYGVSDGFFTSLELYFHKFEFNASLYFILRQMGYWFVGYNAISIIGPFLSLISFILILFLSYRYYLKNTSQALTINVVKEISIVLTICLSIYFFCATTVHPWYIATLVFLSVFSDIKFPIAWSFLAILSYSHYAYNDSYYLSLVCVEYAVLCLFMYIEWKYKKTEIKAIL